VEATARKAPWAPLAATVTRHATGALAAALAFALAVYELGSRSLWGDEVFSVTLAQKPAAEFWHVVSTSQANMSLYYVLLRGWVALGDGEAWIRLLSVLAAVGAVVVLYAVAARLFDRRTATVAAVLLATNAFFLHHAQEARSYALVVLLTAGATFLFVAADERPSSRTLDVAYVGVAAAALYAHFFAAFVVAGHVVALAVAGRPLKPQLLRAALVALLALPLAWFAVAFDAGQVSHLTRPTLHDVASVVRQLAGGTRALTVLFGLGVLVAAARWLRRPRPRRDWAFVVAATWAIVPIAGALAASLGKPLFTARFLIVALPGIVLLSSAGLARLPRSLAVPAVALVAVLAVANVLDTQGREQEDFRAATGYVLANAAEGDAVVFYRTSRQIGFEHYARKDGVRRLPRTLPPAAPYGRFDLVDDYRHTELTTAELAGIREAASRGRLWLFLSAFEDERVEAKRRNRARLIAAVSRSAVLRERRRFAGLDVRLYVPREPQGGA
jgi:hypothetical protein